MRSNSFFVIARKAAPDEAIQPLSILHRKTGLPHSLRPASARRSFAMTMAAVCLLPLAASATKLSDCDAKSYDVIINNGGQVRTVTLTPRSASIEEYGPVLSMTIKGHSPVVITEPYDEYCIWSGKITIQRRNPGNESHGGSGF